jgi:phage/plasmid-associated DNA primase
LLTHNCFSHDKTTDEIAEYYEMSSNLIYAFVKEKCMMDEDGKVLWDEIYAEYVKYCNSKNFPAESKRKFNEELRQKFGLKDYRPTVGDKRKRGWKGIRLRTEIDDNSDGGDYFD